MNQRRTDLVLLYRGGHSSSERGVAYPVVLRNTGSGTFWDVELRALHNGEEVDRSVVRHLGPQSETGQIFLLVPSQYCDSGRPGIGRQPRGHVTADALLDEEVVAGVDLPGNSEAVEVDRVPRTPDEEAMLLQGRQDGWEYLLFAAALRRRMDALEPKYRDHEVRFVRPVPPVIDELDTLPILGAAFGEATAVMDNMNRVLDRAVQDRAFGLPGEAGDALRIEHLAERLIDIYEGMIDWAARIRGLQVAEPFRHAVDIASRFSDLAIQQFREFVDRVVAETDRLPGLLRAGEDVVLTLDLVVSVEDGLVDMFNSEVERLTTIYGGS